MNEKVSIVIIGRNEAREIGKCVGAALAAADQIGGAEIIFVDSASTDKTVEIVRNLGVRVIALKPTMKLSPSAGRYVGSLYAKGEYILFLDADTLVYQDFLPVAIKHFEKNPQVGGINGFLDDLNEKGVLLDDVEERSAELADVRWLRGPCCFYRRAALAKVGSFNPYLAVEEEAELGLRLVKNHWKLHILPLPMAVHTRCFHLQTTLSLISAFRRDLAVGRIGEITKTAAYAFREGYGLTFCWLRLKTTILFTAWLTACSACLLLPLFLHPLMIFTLVFVGGSSAILLKKRSLRQTLVFVPTKMLNFVSVVAGLSKIQLPDAAAGYPVDFIDYSCPAKLSDNQKFTPTTDAQTLSA